MLKIQDDGNRRLDESKNRNISAAVRPISTKFGKEDEWVSQLEELNRSCGLTTATAAVQIG